MDVEEKALIEAKAFEGAANAVLDELDEVIKGMSLPDARLIVRICCAECLMAAMADAVWKMYGKQAAMNMTMQTAPNAFQAVMNHKEKETKND